jgi:hypothetical protein
LRLLKERLYVLHEFIVIERDTDGVLQLFELIGFKEQVMTLFSRDLLSLISDWQRLDNVYHEAPREVTADKAQHLMVVKSRNHLVVRSRVENLLDLLQEALAVESCGTHKGVLSQ